MNAPDDFTLGTHRSRRPPASAIGERVRKLRKLAKLSARETDRLTGLSESHTSLLERAIGERIAAKTAIAIAHTFDVSLDWLLTGAGSEPSTERVLEAVGRARERAARRPFERMDGESFAGDMEERRGGPEGKARQSEADGERPTPACRDVGETSEA